MPRPLTAAFTPEWVAAQRWFRSKQRHIASVAEVDSAEIPGADASLLVLAVTHADGGEDDRYLVPAAGGREPIDGEGAWRGILAAIAADATLEGRRGRFECRSTPSLETLLRGAEHSALTERRLGVEQSNTSVVLGGDRLILKLYRLLEPGLNPDLEVSAFLTEVGFVGAPAVAGSVTYQSPEADASAAAMVQELVPATGDAWASMLDLLARDSSEATRQAAEIGRATAELHDALAARPQHPSFPARAATPEETARWRASAAGQLAQAESAVSGVAHDRLVELAPRIIARFADTFGSAGGAARVSRIHGDYHLGQLLRRTAGGYAVIDFEGEPARPLTERRAATSPLRDVAGMLRSLDYAARTAEAGRRAPGFKADAWLPHAREAFLRGYGRIGSEDWPLLRAFELEKALYEVRYEANNRPDWLWLPLAAIERLSSSVTLEW